MPTMSQPFLTANGLVNSSSSNAATIGYRSVSQGGRTDDYVTDWQQYAVGVDGRAGGWDYNARITAGNSVMTDTLAGGYLDNDCFQAAINSGAYDPVIEYGNGLDQPLPSGHTVLENEIDAEFGARRRPARVLRTARRPDHSRVRRRLYSAEILGRLEPAGPIGQRFLDTSRLRVMRHRRAAAVMFRLAQTGTTGGSSASGMSPSSRASKRRARVRYDSYSRVTATSCSSGTRTPSRD